MTDQFNNVLLMSFSYLLLIIVVGGNMIFPLRFTAIHLIYGTCIKDANTNEEVKITGTIQLLYYTLKMLYSYDLSFFPKGSLDLSAKLLKKNEPSVDKRVYLTVMIHTKAFAGIWRHFKVLFLTHTVFLICSPFRIIWFWYAYIRILITRKTKEKFVEKDKATGNVANTITLEDLNSVIYKSTEIGLRNCLLES